MMREPNRGMPAAWPNQWDPVDGDEQYANNGLLGDCHEMCDVGEECWVAGHSQCAFRPAISAPAEPEEQQ